MKNKLNSTGILTIINSPALDCILDLTDDNWKGYFTPQELLELNTYAKAEIEYPALPKEMHDFLASIPHSSNLYHIYRHLEAQQIDLETQPSLAWLKFSLQSAIVLFDSGYFPLKDQNERDICANVWSMIGRCFSSSILLFRTEKSSIACKEAINKKRKMSANDVMERQQHALIPDMTIFYEDQEFAIIEAAKSNNNTKQIIEGGKKCPEIMAKMFNKAISTCPTQARSIKIYGCLLSQLQLTPLEMSSPAGCVKLLKKGKHLTHPEMPLLFKPRMTALLSHIWRFRLANELILQVMVDGEIQQSEFEI